MYKWTLTKKDKLLHKISTYLSYILPKFLFYVPIRLATDS